MPVEQSSPHSFHMDAESLVRLRLVVRNAAGWREEPARTAFELIRLVSEDGALLVLYRTGSVVVQGQDQERTLRALQRYAERQNQSTNGSDQAML